MIKLNVYSRNQLRAMLLTLDEGIALNLSPTQIRDQVQQAIMNPPVEMFRTPKKNNSLESGIPVPKVKCSSCGATPMTVLDVETGYPMLHTPKKLESYIVYCKKCRLSKYIEAANGY